MNNLKTKLIDSPIDYQVTMRLDQLKMYYGEHKLENAIFLGDYSNNSEIGRHVENLFLTYGASKVMENFDLIYKGKAA